jgi:hypothetical protein
MTMDDITQRKNMAMGKGPMTGDFGVKSFKESNMDGKDMGSSDGTMLSEKARAAPVKGGGGKMMNQAQPEHGPHKWED